MPVGVTIVRGLGDAGACAAGFYCPANSTSNVAVSCSFGLSDAMARSVYCPEGSSGPLLVGIGNYSDTTSGNTFREASLQVCGMTPSLPPSLPPVSPPVTSRVG